MISLALRLGGLPGMPGSFGQEPPGDFQTPRIEGAEPVAAAQQTAVAGDVRGPLFATFDLWPDDETVRSFTQNRPFCQALARPVRVAERCDGMDRSPAGGS